MSARRLAVLAATVLLGSVVPVTTAAQATAASGYCTKGTGVTVVVDRGALGGGTSVGCDPKGANTSGSTVVPRAGFPLTYVQAQPGFVCRVSGVPASAGCANTPPSNAYWGLFWSNGTSGSWTYASAGVGSLKVPAGGFIGWKWQNSNTRTTPGTRPVAPAPAKPSPKPKPKPSPKPSPKPAPKPSPAPGTTAGAAPSAAGSTAAGSPHARQPTAPRSAVTKPARKAAAEHATKQAVRKRKAAARAKRAVASASASASRSAAAATGQAGSSPSPESSPRTSLTSGEQSPDSGSGPMLPLLAAGIVVVLLGAAGRLVWVRRRG